ncbi:hypothetical protein, partial [Mucilaginibacter sp. OK098]|uniref:hypothetical protein n=1 Tax=Mucilaginibacter sp. OK098 TaxID=1855297 RepID=UPI001F46E5A0
LVYNQRVSLFFMRSMEACPLLGLHSRLRRVSLAVIDVVTNNRRCLCFAGCRMIVCGFLHAI